MPVRPPPTAQPARGPSTATYPDGLASPQHILGCELVGDLLAFCHLPLDPPVTQRLVLAEGAWPDTQAHGRGPPSPPSPASRPLTFSELFLSCTNLPSGSTSSMPTLPEAEVCCARWKPPPLPPVPRPLGPELGSSASTRFRLLRPERPDACALPPLLRAAREMVTREEGLGDSFSLWEVAGDGGAPGWPGPPG